ncbi:DDE-type integrase/transposase/recombinase [Pseudomonas sp. NT2]
MGEVSPNTLARQFEAEQPNQKWVTDVTEFKVAGKKLYLSPVLDLYNGEIVAYQTAIRPQYALVGEMLEKAIEGLPEAASQCCIQIKAGTIDIQSTGEARKSRAGAKHVTQRKLP